MARKSLLRQQQPQDATRPTSVEPDTVAALGSVELLRTRERLEQELVNLFDQFPDFDELVRECIPALPRAAQDAAHAAPRRAKQGERRRGHSRRARSRAARTDGLLGQPPESSRS
jgi:hypothetical protein